MNLWKDNGKMKVWKDYRSLPCGEVFCGESGDCIHCFGGKECSFTDDKQHHFKLAGRGVRLNP